MFDLPSFRIGRLFGIPLEVNVSWLLVFFLVTWSLAAFQFADVAPGASPIVPWLVGALTALLFFASVVLHEFSHSLVARLGGLRIAKVTLFLFGGVSQMESEPENPGLEFVMAVAGPGMSLLLAAVLYVVFVILTRAHAPAVLTEPTAYLALVNLVVGIFNLLPGFPMDGGRVLRALFWRSTGDLLKATRWASRIGQALGYMLIAMGLFGAAVGLFGLLWLALLGWFLTSLAAASYRQQVVKSALSQVPVSSLMSSPVVVAPGEMDLEQMIDEYFLGNRHARYPVTAEGRLAGLVSLSQVKSVPRDAWRMTRALDIADRDLDRLVVSAATPVDAVLDRFTGDGPGAVLVTSDGHLTGIVTRSDVVHALQERAASR